MILKCCCCLWFKRVSCLDAGEGVGVGGRMSWVTMDLSPEVESIIGKNTPWIKAPVKVKEVSI